MPRQKKHSSNAAKTAASEQKWVVAGNYQPKVWIPRTPAARKKLVEFAAQLRRDAGTSLSDDTEIVIVQA